MKSLTLTKKQQILLIAHKVSKLSKNNSPKHVLRFIEAVEARG